MFRNLQDEPEHIDDWPTQRKKMVKEWLAKFTLDELTLEIQPALYQAILEKMNPVWAKLRKKGE